ncbi:MAG: RNA polymerase sigma factor [Gaiellaceae bacterium]
MAVNPALEPAHALVSERRPLAAPTASELYERYSARVYRYCLYRLRSREEAEDAAQTTFLYAHRALSRGTVPASEASWLLAIAHNACLARLRAGARRGNVEVASDPQALEQVAWARPDGHDELVDLDDALGAMPEQQRRALVLREWRGLSYREVADEMDLSVAAVETLIFRARRSLAQLLSGESRSGRLAKHGFELSSLWAALKSALGGASTVKLAAGAAAVATAVVAVGGPVLLDRTDARPPEAPIPAPLVAPSDPAPAPRVAAPRHNTRPAAKEQPAPKTSSRPAAVVATEDSPSPTSGGISAVLPETPALPGAVGGLELPVQPVVTVVEDAVASTAGAAGVDVDATLP